MRHRVRATLLLILGLYLLVGPIGRDVLGYKLPRGFQRWVMFAGIARNTCQVRFSQVQPGGAPVPIEVGPRNGKRWRLLRKQLPSLIRKVCAQARRAGHAADVRLEARCGSRRRWIVEHDGTTNVCATRR